MESHSQLVPQRVHVDCDSLKLKILVKYASNKFPIRPLLFPVHRPRIENVTASKNIITAIAHARSRAHTFGFTLSL